MVATTTAAPPEPKPGAAPLVGTLRGSELRYRRLFESAQDGILVLNAETGQIEDANPYLVKMLGYSHAEFLGKKLWEVGPFADIAQTKEMFEQLQTKGYARYDDLPLRSIAGTQVAVEFVSNAYDCDGTRVIQCNIRDISQRKAAEAAVEAALAASRASELRYRRLFEAAQDGILLLNAGTGQIEDVNPYLVKMLGYSHAEFLGKKLWEVGAFADIAQTKEMFEQLQTQGYARYEDLPLRTMFGTHVAVEFVSNAYEAGGVTVIQCNIRNITERKAAEERLRHVTQLYAGLSACNQAIVHCTSAAELFPLICRAAVRFGGMKIAWIGMLDAATGRVLPVASYGDDGEFIKGIEISIAADSEVGHGPTGTAIRERQPSWCQDFQSDPGTGPWRQRAAAAGLAAAASLPLYTAGKVVGAFGMLSDRIDAFDSQARALMSEMGSDVSFALDHYAEVAQHDTAVAQLKAAYLGTIEVATALSEMRDPYTAGHERRVAAIAGAIGTEMGIDPVRLELLRIAGSLHDIGKITVPFEILSKPGKLTPLEYQLVQGHVQASYLVLKEANFPGPVALIAQQHHERMDGSGYPLKLKGDEILLESRIMGVADVVEAMSSHRPYRAALGIEPALAEIARGRGTVYDADVCDACLRIFHEQAFRIPE